MKQEHLYSSDDKLKWWGYGEWVEEYDQAIFEHNGIECMVIRIAIQEPYSKEFHMFGGHLCGYIKVPDHHPYYGKGFDEIDLESGCNGGLTYSEIDDQNHNYLHKKGHWIGFDCAHSFDITPSMEYLKKTLPSMIECEKKLQKYKNLCPDSFLWHRSYKNMSYCIQECKNIADELVNMVKT